MVGAPADAPGVAPTAPVGIAAAPAGILAVPGDALAVPGDVLTAASCAKESIGRRNVRAGGKMLVGT